MDVLFDGALMAWGGLGEAQIPLQGYAFKSDDGTVVWVDPPHPGQDAAALLAFGRPAHVLITFRDHERAVSDIVVRHQAKLWIPRGRGGPFKTPDVEFGEDTALPAGLRAISMPACGFGEHTLVGSIGGKRVAFVGDALWQLRGSRLFPLFWLTHFKRLRGGLYLKRKYRGGDASQVPDQIRKLLDEDLDALLLSHGRPILEDARGLLRRAFPTA